MSKEGREPLIRISKRSFMPLWQSIMVRVVAILIALIVCGFIIFAIVKENPIKVYQSMFNGAFGTNRRMWVTIRDIMMMLCIGVGLAPAFKMKFWNLGAEGQILVGGKVEANDRFPVDA